MKTDIVIVGTGVSGLYCALNLPRDKKIVMVTKADDDKSDSFLAQGGIGFHSPVPSADGSVPPWTGYFLF